MSKSTLFDGVKSRKKIENIEFSTIMELIKSGKWREKVEKYRAGNLDKRDLPAFTGSGTFKGKGRAADLEEHSGRIIMDFDGLDQKTSDKIRALAKKDPFAEYVFASVSGVNLGIVFQVDPDPALHKKYFDAIFEHCLSHYQTEASLDKAVKDVSRMRFVSWDPDLYHNEKAETFVLDTISEERILKIISGFLSKAQDGEKHFFLIRMSYLAGGFVASGFLSEDAAFEALRSEITKHELKDQEAAFKTIRDGLREGQNRPVSVESVKVIERVTDEQLAVNWNALYRQLDRINRAGIVMTKYKADQLSDKVGFDPVVVEKVADAYFKDNLEHFGTKSSVKMEVVEKYLQEKYKFRENTITKIQEQKNGKKPWEPLKLAELWVYIQRKTRGMDFNATNIRLLVEGSLMKSYNPFMEYFEGLDQWDGKTDHIAKLANHIQVNDCSEDLFVSMFKKHLVRQVACMVSNYVNRYVFVLSSEEQSTGKSTFLRFLNPFPEGKYYSESPTTGDKDFQILISDNAIVNLEELASMDKRSVNKLKALISQGHTNVRRPYARQHEMRSRLCTFWGSTNDSDFLLDSNNTRWLCFEVAGISWDYSKDIDINKVYAQAWALYKFLEFDFELSTEERAWQKNANKSFENESLEKIFIREKFAPGADHFYTTAHIAEAIQMAHPSLKINTTFVGKIMAQLEFKPSRKTIDGQKVRGYYLDIRGAGNPYDREQDEQPF